MADEKEQSQSIPIQRGRERQSDSDKKNTGQTKDSSRSAESTESRSRQEQARSIGRSVVRNQIRRNLIDQKVINKLNDTAAQAQIETVYQIEARRQALQYQEIIDRTQRAMGADLAMKAARELDRRNRIIGAVGAEEERAREEERREIGDQIGQEVLRQAADQDSQSGAAIEEQPGANTQRGRRGATGPTGRRGRPTTRRGFQRLLGRFGRGGGTSAAEEGAQVAQTARRVEQASAFLTRARTALASLRLGALLANPYVLGGLLLLLGIGIVVGLLFMFGSFAFKTDPRIWASSQTEEVDLNNQSQMQELRLIVNGGLINEEKARQIIELLVPLQTQAGRFPEALLAIQTIRAAAQGIIDSPSSAEEQTAVIAEAFTDLAAAIPEETVSFPTSAIVLDVPGVPQTDRGHCGKASMAMVALYYDPNYSSSWFRNGRTTHVQSCPIAGQIDVAANRAGKGGWIYASWRKYTRDGIINAMKRSINGRDPLVLYTNPGCIFRGQHIVAIVGFDPDDEPTQGGTFYMNNPFPGGVRMKTNKAAAGVGGHKLTSNYLKGCMGGDGGTYGHSVAIRRIYLES